MSYEFLQILWFILIAVLWIGFFFLEGFDFGVGMLLPFLGKKDEERRAIINSIGSVWDGNEVWLLTAGGATFAAFPHWYATLFSGFYLPLLLILVALIVRNMGFDYRGKRDNAAWKANWDKAIIIGSFLPALLWGVALTNIVRGVPIDQNMEYTGNLVTLLNPIGLLGGLVFVALFLTHGAYFVALKTDGPIRADARALATKTGLVAAGLAVILLLVLGISKGSVWSWLTTAIAAVALLFSIWANTKSNEGQAFAGTAVTIGAAVATYFFLLYPNVMPSSTDDAFSLTIHNASSTDYTLKIMTIAALVFTPIVLAYQAWTYWVFRKRIRVEHLPAAQDPGHVPVGTR